jgi:hypothetical protein
MERGRSALGLAVVEILRFVFVTVAGPQVQIHDDFHLFEYSVGCGYTTPE